MSAVTNSTWTTLSFVNEAASSSSTTTSFVTLKWKCFKMVCSHVEEEPFLQELTGVVIPTKLRMSDWIYTPASSGRGKHLHWGYCQICCIALRILQTSKEFWVFLFRQSSQQTSSETHVYLYEYKRSGFAICDWWLSICPVFSVFQGSLLVIVQVRAIMDQFASKNFLIFLVLDYLSLARIKQCLPPSLDKNSTHHRDCLRHSQFWFCGPSWASAFKHRDCILISANVL